MTVKVYRNNGFDRVLLLEKSADSKDGPACESLRCEIREYVRHWEAYSGRPKRFSVEVEGLK